MARNLFHLLLTLTLVFNGLAPAWAMNPIGHGEHDAHGQAAAHADTNTPVAKHDHASMHDHAAMSGNAKTHPTELADTQHPDMGVCCDGPTGCECGCVLPPAMLFSMQTSALHALVVAPQRQFYDALSLALNTPPFRPPAV